MVEFGKYKVNLFKQFISPLIFKLSFNFSLLTPTQIIIRYKFIRSHADKRKSEENLILKIVQ